MDWIKGGGQIDMVDDDKVCKLRPWSKQAQQSHFAMNQQHKSIIQINDN